LKERVDVGTAPVKCTEKPSGCSSVVGKIQELSIHRPAVSRCYKEKAIFGTQLVASSYNQLLAAKNFSLSIA
jgi:hypothetical protein